MSHAIGKVSDSSGYVHKLRLESRDGVQLAVIAPKATKRRQGSWVVAKFVGLSIATTSLLMIAARQL